MSDLFDKLEIMAEEYKRLFFGIDVSAPWPEELPEGRILDESSRHLTLAFLGKVDFAQLSLVLPTMPQPHFKLGLAGWFSECLFLPEKHPHVAAWQVEWFDDPAPLLDFYQRLNEWLKEQNLLPREPQHFLPHVTICRSPFLVKQWKKAFEPLPMAMRTIHLYESFPQSHYESCWEIPLKAPFEEIEHTADIAYIIRGENPQQLFNHAFAALAFKYPPFLPYFIPGSKEDSLEEIIMKLNEVVAKTDAEVGCPIKAVSFHGTIEQEKDQTLSWEMIVDV